MCCVILLRLPYIIQQIGWLKYKRIFSVLEAKFMGLVNLVSGKTFWLANGFQLTLMTVWATWCPLQGLSLYQTPEIHHYKLTSSYHFLQGPFSKFSHTGSQGLTWILVGHKHPVHYMCYYSRDFEFSECLDHWRHWMWIFGCSIYWEQRVQMLRGLRCLRI